MTTGLFVFLSGAGLVVILAAILIVLIYPPMRRLLGVNSTLAAARSFYGRTFFIVMLLAAAIPIINNGAPGPAEADNGAATQAPEAGPTFMECVWHMGSKLDDVFLSIGIFLMGYVLMLTIVFAALGRFRDQ